MRNIGFLMLILAMSCSCSHKSKITIIPANKLKGIITDIQLIDAYYLMHNNQYLNVNDSTSFYKQVFDRNGVTKAQFDSSLLYYSKREPKKYETIYEEVMTDLNRMNQDIYVVRSMILDSAKNLYKGKHDITLSGKGSAEKLPFGIVIKDTGTYEITVQIQIFNDDQSKHLRLTAFSTCSSCLDKKKNQYFEPVKYEKSSMMRIYKITQHIISLSQKDIRGWILDQDDQKNKFQRHIHIAWIFIKKLPVQPHQQGNYLNRKLDKKNK